MPRADALSRLVGGDEPNEPSLGFRLRRADAAAEFLGASVGSAVMLRTFHDYAVRRFTQYRGYFG